MSRKIDLTGRQFGRLIVLRDTGLKDKYGMSIWLCECNCGNKVKVSTKHLGKSTKSCGCLRKDTNILLNTKHGKSNTRLWKTWYEMKNRCNNKDDSNFYNYGGRGIKVCDDWNNNFEHFYDWALKHGYSDALTIDRINNNGNYEPNNCRWISRAEQNNNKRNNHLLTYNGKTQNIKKWSEELGLKWSTIYSRLHQGWSIERTLSTPTLINWSRVKSKKGK